MEKVADWQLTNASPSDKKHIGSGTEWTYGAFYAGVMALDSIAENSKYHDAMVAIGKKYNWQPGSRRYHADDQCVGQMYLELYLEDHDPASMRAMILTNVLGPALLVRETLPHLRASKGRIVIVGSVAGTRNTPGNLYSVTKWAAHALAENVRLLATKDGVGVTVVAPGVVDTPFWDERGGSPEAAPTLTAEQVAGTILFAVNQPAGVDVSSLVVRPAGQVG